MALAAQFTAQYDAFTSSALSAVKDPIIAAETSCNANFGTSRVIKPGETLPALSLPDATGQTISSAPLLAKSPFLITFYRSEWCHFCNIVLAELQNHVPEYHARGVEFIAISPELPNAQFHHDAEAQTRLLSDL